MNPRKGGQADRLTDSKELQSLNASKWIISRKSLSEMRTSTGAILGINHPVLLQFLPLPVFDRRAVTADEEFGW
jgi:hypothetical protein